MAKSYDPHAWERYAPADALQRIYDDLGWGGTRGRWRQRSVHRLAVRLHEISRRKPGPVTLLDVACFSGDYFGRLIETKGIEDLLRYTGLDVSASYIRHAADRWRGYSQPRFLVASALQIPFQDRTFDMVFNSGMLIHMADPGRCIAEFARVARILVLIETTVDPTLKTPFIDENKSGDRFIDRVYRDRFIEDLIAESGTVIEATYAPADGGHVSALYECIPK